MTISLKDFLSLFIYFWERQRQIVCMGEGQREGGRESQAGSVLSAWSPTWGSNSRTMRSWAELKPRAGCLTDWLSAPGYIISLKTGQNPLLCRLAGLFFWLCSFHLGCRILFHPIADFVLGFFFCCILSGPWVSLVYFSVFPISIFILEVCLSYHMLCS